MKGYLRTALNPKIWERNSATISEKYGDVRSIVGPEDFVSVIVLLISIVAFLAVIAFGKIEGKYIFMKHLQFLFLASWPYLLAVNKSRLIEQNRPMKEINRARIWQCTGIWLNGAVIIVYLTMAFA